MISQNIMRSVVNNFLKRNSGVVQYLAGFSGILNIITSGMHYGWPSPSLPILQDLNNTETLVHVTSSEGGWIAVMPLLGSVLGSIIAGSLVDIIGRKPMIILSCFPFFSAWMMVAYSKSVAVFCVARYIAGLTDGLIFSSVPIYIGEIADKNIRGFLGSGVGVAVIVGIVLINLLGFHFSITTTALISSAVPVLCLLTIIWMPNSPYFLLMKGKHEEARLNLQILRGTDNVDEELIRLSKAVEASQSGSNGKFSDVLTVKSNRKALLIMMLLRTAQQFSGITAFTFYTVHIFKETGNDISPKTATLIFFGVHLAMALVSSSIVDLTGRRILLIISCVGSAIALFVEGLYFHLKTTSIDVSSYYYVPVAALIIYVIVFSLGLQTIPILMLGELFPTNIKAFALCFAELYFSLLATVVSKFFQITKDSVGMFFPFYVFTFSCVFCLVLIVLFVPETKGKTLEEIQSNLKGEKIDSDSQ